MVPEFRAKEIKPAKTVGQRLKAARQRRGLNLETAELQTKVKLKYLKALEDDRHDLLPTEVYSLGFLRCYGEALGLNTAKLQQQYRAERLAFRSAKGQTPQALAPARRIASPYFVVTPKTLFTLFSVTLVGGLLLYLTLGIRSFLAPPELAVDEPRPDSRITANTLTVAGLTDPTASLTINGELVTVEADGKFRREIAVVPGLNTLEFVAINRVGKEQRAIRKVLADYQVTPSPEPTPNPSAAATASPSPSPKQSSSPAPTTSPSPNPSPEVNE